MILSNKLGAFYIKAGYHDKALAQFLKTHILLKNKNFYTNMLINLANTYAALKKPK